MYLTKGNTALDIPTREDLSKSLEIRNDYEDVVNYRTWKPLTELNQNWYWENVVNNKDHAVFTIFQRRTEMVIGEVRISNIDWKNRCGEIGVILHRKFRGKGHGKEAIEMIVGYGFDRLNLHRLEAQCVASNKASRGVFRSLGFEEEGYIKDAMFTTGRYEDIIIAGLINPNHRYLY